MASQEQTVVPTDIQGVIEGRFTQIHPLNIFAAGHASSHPEHAPSHPLNIFAFCESESRKLVKKRNGSAFCITHSNTEK
jgi:hypothetical protein